MIRTFLTLILISALQLTYGQVATKKFKDKDALENIKYIRGHEKAKNVKKFPSFDVNELIEEDKLNEKLDIPFRFGKGFDVSIGLLDGEWVDTDNGRLWSMEFESEGAYSINFVFNRLYLPDDAELYISNKSGTVLYGPVTSQENTKNGFFLTDLIQGDNVTIYLFEPKNQHGKSELKIKRVVHAYKNLIPMSYGNLGGSESCNNDIACFPGWDQESDAVALVLLSDGTEWCSGSLLMTASQTFDPYFLSAFHCIDTSSPYGSISASEISDAENWMFKFQYKMTSCSGSTATTGITYNGAQYRAAWNNSDFVLMEMDNSPLGDTQFSWLGWDRSGNTPTSGTCIHHPSGDVMKISFENNQFQTSSWGGTNNHWLVSFDDGIVEHGSSGSPILDQNGRIVGQLHGNQNYDSNLSYCSQPRAEYGRFNLSWTGGGTDETRLSNWLDPCNSGVLSTNTARSPLISGPSMVCSSGTSFTINNLPSGATVTWDQSYGIERSSQQGSNPCTFIATSPCEGWIEATINTNCGSVTLPSKTVWAGTPYLGYFDQQLVDINTNMPLSTVCENDMAYGKAAHPAGEAYIDDWDWTISGGGAIYPQGVNDQTVEIFAYPGSSYLTIQMKAHNACGWSDWGMEGVWVYNCGGYYMTFSPNPTSIETIMTIESESTEKIVDENEEWDLVVYDQGQKLKLKKQKLKGKSTQINTQNWKEGVYLVRVKYKDEIITGKLIKK